MKRLVNNDRWEIDKDYNIDKLLYLLIDRPCKITDSNSFVWLNNKNQRHRDYNLPALIYNDGDATWYLNGSNKLVLWNPPY